MSFITDNFITNFFNNSTKTDEDLDKFINKKFTSYLNNSNLLLNFVSDFEDYKINGRNDNRSKCDECESLYILTSEIFENYINRVKIPFDITIYGDGKEKYNYNNKVLYFFDLKDLNKILQSKNLAKNSDETRILNKKRILCKIISLSFIKIYIIIKSIFQTFNIYSSLVNNKNKIRDAIPMADEMQPNPDEMQPNPDEMQPNLEKLEPNPDEMQPNPEELEPNPDEMQPNPDERQPNPDEMQPNPEELEPNPDERQPNPEERQPNPEERHPNQHEEMLPNQREEMLPNQREEMLPNPEEKQRPLPGIQPNIPLSGGGFFDFLNPLRNKAEGIKNEIPQDEPQRSAKLQTSSNVFYSIFVILFENEEVELTSKNFTADYLNKNLDIIKNENLVIKLPRLLNYICSKKVYLSDFILKNSLIFNDNNFKFLRLKISDTLENDVTFYLKEIDEKNKKYTLDTSAKLKELEKCFTKENVAFIENYCKTNNLDLTNLNILSSVKGFLQKMIANYFKNRNRLYDSIIKKLIKFNARTNEIENINPSLTYVKILELTEQAKSILLDLHIDIFKSLNSIVNKIRVTLIHKYGSQITGNNVEKPPISEGGKKTKRYYKKQNKKHNKRTKKYNRK